MIADIHSVKVAETLSVIDRSAERSEWWGRHYVFHQQPTYKVSSAKNSVSIVDMKRHGGWTNSSGNDLILQLWPAHFQWHCNKIIYQALYTCWVIRGPAVNYSLIMHWNSIRRALNNGPQLIYNTGHYHKINPDSVNGSCVSLKGFISW